MLIQCYDYFENSLLFAIKEPRVEFSNIYTTIFIVLSQFITELVNFHLGSDMYDWMGCYVKLIVKTGCGNGI